MGGGIFFARFSHVSMQKYSKEDIVQLLEDVSFYIIGAENSELKSLNVALFSLIIHYLRCKEVNIYEFKYLEDFVDFQKSLHPHAMPLNTPTFPTSKTNLIKP